MSKHKMSILDAVSGLSILNAIEGNGSVDMIWAIDDIKESLKKHSERYYTERDAILAKYGTEMESSQEGQRQYVIKEEKNREKYKEELEALGKIEVEIEFATINYDAFIGQGLRAPAGSGRIMRLFIEEKKVKEKKKEIPDKKVKKLKPDHVPATTE